MPLFMLAKLPLGLIAGLRVRHIDDEVCDVTVPYGWRTTNPFKSTYFAALTMAAEMSTGALAMATVRASPEPISMLVVGLEGEFLKKATQVTTFRCAAGKEMSEAVLEALETGEGVVRRVETIGTAPDGTVVARFCFTWSFKKKRSRAS
jgi:hypothetical protein